MPTLLEQIEFRDPLRARREILSLISELESEIQLQIESLLVASPDPDRAVVYLSRLKQWHPGSFARFCASPGLLHQLIAVFCYSRFLSEELLKTPAWLEHMDRPDRLFSAEHYALLLEEFLAAEPGGGAEALPLATFRRRQILRILIRDVMGLCSLAESTTELSNLAEAILETGYRRIRNELVAKYGTPRYRDDAGELRECGMAVIALGKLGGGELNYSSDVDLMFVYTAPGQTDGANPISNKEFYKKVANQYTQLLSTHTQEGLCYRVDLRLRPDGSLGEVCISLDGAKKYYQTRARDWELQMLIKARVVAGDRETGRELLDSTEPLIYSTTLDFSAVEAVSATRERISEKLNQRRGKPGLDVKLTRGGIRDIEFLVQCLQRLHGGRVPWVRHGGTLHALARLSDKDLLSPAEYGRLATAYQFLRDIEHRLQFEDDLQTHTLPSNPSELGRLARKMPIALLGSAPTPERLLQELNAHLESVQEIYERVIHAQRPIYYSATPTTAMEIDPADTVEPQSSNLVRFLDQRAPYLAEQLSRQGLRRGAREFEHFLEKVVSNPAWLGLLDNNEPVARNVLDIFEHSPYFSDELIRSPDLIETIADLTRSPHPTDSYNDLALLLNDASDLRRFFRREMFRIQAASLCLRIPVFETLRSTSDLADAAISAAYRMALDNVLEAHPPANPLYPARNQMMVIALGRLGMREFDLASDADLVFVVPDTDQSEHVFWTRVANRMIDLLTAYTSTGIMFAVDTRLRPNGGAGALVQSETAFKEYFATHAEAWEGIAYLKSRAVAGNVDQATLFLNALQELDWRRYGQSGRSKKDLRQMRTRLEKEQGPSNPLKAGPGGFFDIDFTLLYLRLKSAGIFFKVLNMPERIDIIEKMGHLERAEADFLRDAVIFYRAVDHGMRIYSGHAEGKLPHSESQLASISEIVHRWTPQHLNRQPLPAQLALIRQRTREIFDHLFGDVRSYPYGAGMPRDLR
jgi:glutamate-ammonia-ligase adenylyltransferase